MKITYEPICEVKRGLPEPPPPGPLKADFEKLEINVENGERMKFKTPKAMFRYLRAMIRNEAKARKVSKSDRPFVFKRVGG